MHKIKYLTILMLLSLITVAIGASTGLTWKVGTSSASTEWITYTDPRFDYSLEYPTTWYLVPRDDRPGYVGGTLTFSAPKLDGAATCGESAYARIEIGLYLVEYEPTQALADWSEKYDKINTGFSPDEIQVKGAYSTRVGDLEVYRKEAVSPLTHYTYVNVPHGKTMWFIWTNATGEQAAVFEHVVNSFKFGKNTPTTLQEAYGQGFQALLLERREGVSILKGSATPLSISNDYRVPVNGPTTRYILCGGTNAPICNGTHSGSAAKAIDISLPTGNSIKNSATSYENSAGWDSSGYGNLVTMYDSTNGYVAYYAHLSSINWSNLYNYWPVPQGMEIGLSGCSGNCGGAHLHFHVRTTGWAAVNLSGMPNLSLNGNYPNCGYTTCPNPPDFQCTCGQVY
jgi:murein DD-endopeptidase MepM/ murein hydrolase activator NlpD